MKTARYKMIAMVPLIAVALVSPRVTQATAGSPQVCEPGATCEVGEFLYNDDYSPVTSVDSCLIYSRYPNGDLYLDNQAMSASGDSDGWWSYSFTAPTTEGMYRTSVCCTIGGSEMCLDKSFEVKADPSSASSSDIASAVWNHSSRTLSGFGSLISDIWSNSTRTLSSLVMGTTNVTNSVTNIENTTNETRLLLEKLVNKPVIETTIEEVPDLGQKLKDSRNVANQLLINSQYLVTNSARLSARSSASVLSELVDILGEDGDSTGDKTIFAQINYLSLQWDFEVVKSIAKQAKTIRTLLAQAQRGSSSYFGYGSAAVDARRIVVEAETLAKLIGANTDSGTKNTLFGKLNETQSLAGALDKENVKIDKVLAGWQGYGTDEKEKKVTEFKRNVLAINLLPKVKSIFSSYDTSEVEDKKLKNVLFGLKGVLASNKIYLAKKAGSAFGNTWLEEGSMVFKTLVTNPSDLISQDVPLKYYMPDEVREEHIIEVDDGLDVKYDSERDQYYVEGSFTLDAGETKTFSVKVDDIWRITQEEVDAMRRQAEELARPLERTSYFAQGVTLKSDIDVSLDKVISLQKNAFTPEEKIRAFREAKIEMQGAKAKMEKLKDLATQAGSANSLFGFVGGAQAIAVWGLIIILVAGFAFLALYMRTIGGLGKRGKKVPAELTEIDAKANSTRSSSSLKRRELTMMVIAFIFSGLVSSIIAVMVTTRVLSARFEKEKEEALTQANASLKTDLEQANKVEMPSDQSTEAVLADEDEARGGQDYVLIRVPGDLQVNVRSGPSSGAKIIGKIGFTKEAVRLAEEGEWVEIALEDLPSQTGWVHADFVEEPEGIGETQALISESSGGDLGRVVVKETETGWLRVRNAPWGEEIGRVYPGESFALLDQAGGWYQIETTDGLGWVHGNYVSVE